MAKYASLAALFDAIADAIRAKTESTAEIVAENFPEEIANISTAGSSVGIVHITASNIGDYFSVTNGTYKFAESGGVFTSNNGGVKSSTATTTLTALADMDVFLVYSYSSEAKYDLFSLKIGGTFIENGSSGATTQKIYSGSVVTGDSIVFTYTKDASTNSNDDKCTFVLAVA